MPPMFRQDRNQTFDQTGKLVSEEVVQVDVTGDAIRDNARQALAGNRTYVGTATPTAAQTTAQVKALSRQVNGIIRLLLNELDGTD